MTKLSFQLIREDIAPIVEKIEAFEFVSGEKRTLTLQLLNAYNSQDYVVPIGKTVTLCMPTADSANPIQKAMTLETNHRSIATTGLTIIDTGVLISGPIQVIVSTDSDSTKATATITINDNSFDVGDSVTVDGTEFVVTDDWTPGVDTDASATALAAAIDAGVASVTAAAVGSIITITAVAFGESGNSIEISENDTGTDNFTLSDIALIGGDFGADVMRAIRRSIFTKTKA